MALGRGHRSRTSTPICARLLGCEQWLEHQYDDDVQDAIRADFAAAIATRTRDEWAAELPGANTCTAPVYSIDELVDDPQFQARGDFCEVVHPEHGTFRQVAPTFAGMARPTGPLPVPDWSKTNTDELLVEAGLAAEDVQRMRDDGVVA